MRSLIVCFLFPIPANPVRSEPNGKTVAGPETAFSLACIAEILLVVGPFRVENLNRHGQAEV